MSARDFTFSVVSKEALLGDLFQLELAVIVGEGPPVPVPGVAVDYVGRVVEVPATLDYSVFPPSVVYEASYLPGKYAIVRLTGPTALVDERAAMIEAAGLQPGGTALSDLNLGRWSPEPPIAPPPAPAPIVRTLASVRAQTLERVEQRRKELSSVFSFRAKSIQSGPEDRTNILGAMLVAQANPAFTTNWRCADNSWLELDAAGILEMYVTGLTWIETLFARHRLLEAEILAAATIEELDTLAPEIETFVEEAS